MREEDMNFGSLHKGEQAMPLNFDIFSLYIM